MPTFAYTAIDAASGQETQGSIAGANPRAVTADLKARGLHPVSLIAASSAASAAAASAASASPPPARSRFGLSATPGRAKLRLHFTRQLATLVSAGLPILRGLEVLGRQPLPASFRRVVASLAETIRGGGNLSDGLAQHPQLFDRLYLNLVKAGEASGALDVVLVRLAEFLEKAERVRRQVQAAMMYPLIIMLVSVGVVGALTVFVVPRFESIFATMLKGQSLPALTQAVLALSRFGQGNFGLGLVVTAGLVLGGRAWLRTAVGERVRDRLLLWLPVAGAWVRQAAIARFARTLGTLLSSGVPILEALAITRDTAGNVHLAAAIDVVQARVRAGEGLAGPLEAVGEFPALVSSLVEVGEETGQLPLMLERVAATYDEEVDAALSALTALVEPVMIVLMAGVVGTVVIALFLPLVRIVQTLS